MITPTDVFLVIEEISSGNSLDEIIGSRLGEAMNQFQPFKFTILEEKRKNLGKGKKDLKDCEPQVAGEAVALYVKWLFQVIQ